MTLRQRLEHAFRAAPANATETIGDWAALATARGPREENQERAFIATMPETTSGRPAFLVAAVLDGIGGMERGGLAASLAATVFLHTILETPDLAAAPLFSHAIEAANAAVHRRLHGRGGTTLTALGLSSDGEGLIVHAGDSRAYRHAAQSRLDQLTVDDTLAGMLGLDGDGLLDTGLMQFVGLGDSFLFQSILLGPASDSTVLALTDGAYFIGPATLRQIHDTNVDVGDIARSTLAAAIAMDTRDNATVVVTRPDAANLVRSAPPVARSRTFALPTTLRGNRTATGVNAISLRRSP